MLAVIWGSACTGLGAVSVPVIFSNNMVLQRDMPVPVWGWAKPGERVTCEMGGGKVTGEANADGQWMLRLPAMPAGGPFEMEVRGENTLKFTGVLVGEVWVCSGQSNMEMGVGMSKDGKKEVGGASHAKIRLFLVPRRASGRMMGDVEARWKECSPASIVEGGWNGFSAVAYYFGRELQEVLKVPIGLIESSWGGTRIEPWTPPVGFAGVPELRGIGEKVEVANADYVKATGAVLERVEQAVKLARRELAEGKAMAPISVVIPKHRLEGSGDPSSLYNGMIHPLVPFGMRGVIWYQGESNNGEGMLYLAKMKALIGGWRKVWGQGDFPFLYVQIAPYKYGLGRMELPMIWNAQLAALTIPNTGMAVTTDIATVNDIHPPNKQEVGHRLALWALAKTYGKPEYVFSGPIYRGMKVSGNQVTVAFDEVGTGLDAMDDLDLTHFELAGEEGTFFPAKATIVGEMVVVTAEGLEAPTRVRMGWDQLARPNLGNKEGFPASPFSSAELGR